MAFTLRRSHTLTLDEAHRRAEQAAEALERQFKLRSTRENDRLAFKGRLGRGHLVVRPDEIELHVAPSRLLPISEKRLESIAAEYLDAALTDDRPLSPDPPASS